jgi:hypothetical protein
MIRVCPIECREFYDSIDQSNAHAILRLGGEYNGRLGVQARRTVVVIAERDIEMQVESKVVGRLWRGSRWVGSGRGEGSGSGGNKGDAAA